MRRPILTSLTVACAMGVITADYFVPGVTDQPDKMFGICVGKKCC